MKTTINLFLSVCFFLSANAQTGAQIILSGKIKNPTNDSLRIQDAEGKIYGYFKLDKSGTFRDTLNLKTGMYELSDDNEYTSLWLKPGFNLHISIDTRKFDESVKYKGIGASENNFLARKYLFEEKLEFRTSYSYYARKPEKDFLLFMDSLETLRMGFLNKHRKGMDSNFYALQKMLINYDRRGKMHNYESMHAYLTKDPKFRVSEQYPNPFTGIELDRVEWISYYEYTNVVSDYIFRLCNGDSGLKHGRDYYVIYLEKLEQNVANQQIRAKLASDIGNYSLGYTRQLDSLYFKLMDIVTDTASRTRISGLYDKLKMLVKGKKSQDFSFVDRSGKIYNLDSFKGKIVYIDVWATWCGPCIAEMPAMAALQDSLKGKDIVFVSICKSDLRSSWENFLEKKKPGGIQLFAEDNDAAFFIDYVIQGIPRFILLDREGRIIDADAGRPSHPGILQELNKLLE